MQALALGMMISAAAAGHAGSAHEDDVATFIHKMLGVSKYERSNVDLNGDGHDEIFVYVTDQSFCGSGGCTLIVLSPQTGSYRVVMRSTVTQLPIRILATSTRGWRDVGVTVSGGGVIRPYTARLRFNGYRYPSNPTVPPVVALKQPSGRVLIGSR